MEMNVTHALSQNAEKGRVPKVRGQSALHAEFQTSLNCKVKPGLKKRVNNILLEDLIQEKFKKLYKLVHSHALLL